MVCTTIDRFKTGGTHNGASRLAAVVSGHYYNVTAKY